MYIDHVGINTNDMEATLQFYCGLLGMRLVRTTRTPDGRRHYNVEIGGGNASRCSMVPSSRLRASANM
jgi:catechol 2,3-dioxygenase-like lactoylglutathione lyase family enzyme